MSGNVFSAQSEARLEGIVLCLGEEAAAKVRKGRRKEESENKGLEASGGEWRKASCFSPRSCFRCWRWLASLRRNRWRQRAQNTSRSVLVVVVVRESLQSIFLGQA